MTTEDNNSRIDAQKEDKLIEDAFQHLLDTYLASPHRKKVDIITKAFHFAKQAHKGVRRLRKASPQRSKTIVGRALYPSSYCRCTNCLR